MTASMLLTDLYQLTMAYGYWKEGRTGEEAVFHLFYRRAPFGGDGVIAAGIEAAVDYLRDVHLNEEEAAYLRGLRGADGEVLFEEGFLDYLREMDWALEVDAVQEGEFVLPNEPMVRVKGPLIQAQLVETALLNLVNFQTLIATKAARVVAAAEGDAVYEFGLRRAQGVDGGLSASRAAYLGGCEGTSNVLAGQCFGIPVKGTHAHSWVMSYEGEREAFEAYARALPNNVVLLVDTYDTVEGVKVAAEIGLRLREEGHELLGVRLDSGDLVELSKKARAILDEAGLPEAKVVASNDLDEGEIARLKKAGARIDIWGVGTKLVTAYDQPALGGVYKLAAIREAGGEWEGRIKLSDDLIKVSNPGILNVARRRGEDGHFEKDVIFDERGGDCEGEKLLRPVLRGRETLGVGEELAEARERAKARWAEFSMIEAPCVELHAGVEEEKRMLLDRAKK